MELVVFPVGAHSVPIAAYFLVGFPLCGLGLRRQGSDVRIVSGAPIRYESGHFF